EDEPGGACGFEIFAAEMSQPEIKALARRGLLDDIGVPVELVANSRPNEIGPIRIKSLLHHQIDVAEIDVAEADGELLGVTAPRPQLMDWRRHRIPSDIHPHGWYMASTRRRSRPRGSSGREVRASRLPPRNRPNRLLNNDRRGQCANYGLAQPTATTARH